ncbi:hypothetical protein CBR_g39555 [Chara braunii]|uniref:Integrase zinc-binding domain-containing protein n=1 Tax=Chara braunii TaxID=69332 RepID=A0A388LRZ8_CHABU|nr:hypothetical protein CBR_g39555 [Chara braunii]|eukprot:GBG85094.1 hypothetical protein CBR_g39555 [Chara braunii]
MPESGGVSDDARKVLTLEDLIAVIDWHEKTSSNVPKVDTFHFNGERVSDWLDLLEQAMVGWSDAVKFQQILRYVLHGHHQEVGKVVDAAHGSWARFREGMQRKYRLGDGLLTTTDLEAMNKDIFTTIGAFVQEFKKRARKVHGISEEAQYVIFLGLLTASEASELTSHGGGSVKLTWVTIDKGVEDGSLDQVEQHQVRLQRQKRNERDAMASGTPEPRPSLLARCHRPLPVHKGAWLEVGTRARAIKAMEEGVVEEEEVGMVAVEGDNGMAKARGIKEVNGAIKETKARQAQAAQTRGKVKASASQEPPRQESEPGKRKEAVEVEDDDDEEEEDERLRQEEDQRAEQRAKKRGAREEAEPVLRDGPPKKKKYAVRLEEGFDVEKVIYRLLEGHNDLMTLKEIFASAPKLRDGLKGRLSRRLVPNVHLGTILPKEAEWIKSGTKMDWKCVACGTVDLVVKGFRSTTMVDTGAETNIIREDDEIRFGLDIDRSDCGILHGANCKAVSCGTASNVLIEVGKVKARVCFFIMPDVDHGILLGRSLLSRTETVIFNKHDGTLSLVLCGPACGNYEVITCRNTGPRSIRNRPNPGSFTIEESEGERRRLLAEPEEEERIKAFSLSLSDVSKVMDIVAAHEMADPDAIQALREQVQESPEVGRLELVYRLPDGRRNPAAVHAQADDEFEEGEIKKVFRAEEYEGIYLELRLLLSCEMRLRDASDRAQRMMQRYLVRDGHLFVRREVGNPRRVVCGRNCQIDVMAALHDGIAGGHRGVNATYTKISELYYWDGMMDMIGKFCRSCVPCQERSHLRSGESLHPRLEREVGVVVHLDLLFMPLGDQGYNYIFDVRDNLSGFVDGRAIRTKTGPVLISCIEKYYLRYPFVREFVMDRGSEFTCQEVQELLSRSDFTKTVMPRGGRGTRSPRRPLGASGGYEQHGSRHRESTTVYDDGDIELFLDSFWGYAESMGWITMQAIERLRGADRFAEPIAQIRREARTRSEVEMRMQELRPSPVGPDGRPIRLEIGNAKEFIPAFDWFMQGQEALPEQQPSAPPRAPEIPEMWRDFWEQRGKELPSPTRAGFGVARKAEERLDRKIKFQAKTTFDRYLLLESDLAGKKTKEEGHGLRLETMEVEIQELRALVNSQAAIIEDLRQQLQERVNKAKSSRQEDQRQSGHGLPGQPSAAGSRQESPMGRVILEPLEAKAKREAEREAFEFRAPTKLATLPIVAVGPVMPLAVEEGQPPSSSESTQGSAEGSMDAFLEAVHTMQEEASLFSPEQRIEEPHVREMGIETEDVIEGGPQRLDTPKYGPEGIGIRSGPSTQELGAGPE